MRSLRLSRLLVVLLTVAVVGGATGTLVAARTIGHGHPPHPGFSGYVASDGSELGVGRLASGRWGICLDTGAAWHWPDHVPPSRLVTDPVVGFLTSRWLARSAHDPVLAAALWWAVGERLNSHPLRVSAHIARMQRETPRRARQITALHDRLVQDALTQAPAAPGYAAPRLSLTRAGVDGIGVRSATEHWVAGLPVEVRVGGAVLPGGSTVWRGHTGATPLHLAIDPAGPVPVTVEVRVTDVPTSRFRLYTPRADRRQRVAASAPLATLAARASVPFTPVQPRLSTQVNAQRAVAGATLVDRVMVSGLSPEGVGATGEWQLFGPVVADGAGTCARPRWAGAPLLRAGTFGLRRDGTVDVGATRVSRAGCYGFRERLAPTPYERAVPWTVLGIPAETSTVRPVAPPIPRHPVVDTGGESEGTGEVAERAQVRRIAVPAVGLSATVGVRRFVGRTLRPPREIARGAIWDAGAPIDAVAGTTVVVGHVSDDHDRQGPFSRLQRSRNGQRVVLTAGPLATRWRIVAIRRVSREALPRTYFVQTMQRRLVLITCTGRVTTPGGGFHYRQNLIVVAVPA